MPELFSLPLTVTLEVLKNKFPLYSFAELSEKLSYYFGQGFVRNAMLVGVLVALCSSLLGVTLVLKRFSFIGDGLSHAAFGAMAVAAVVGLTNRMMLILPVTVVTAVTAPFSVSMEAASPCRTVSRSVVISAFRIRFWYACLSACARRE